MTLSTILFIGGYFFLRLAYNLSDKFPFTQEIILVILGTIATILITAMLLNKQTSVELEKEQNVKFIDLKTETYQELINTIETIVISENITDTQLTKLRFHAHRLAIFASPDVLKEYRNFLDVFHNKVSRDKQVSIDDADALSQALAKLTVYIRADLIGELDMQSGAKRKNITQQILENSTI
jgi:type II secretory pathway pseudopilin PulG